MPEGDAATLVEMAKEPTLAGRVVRLQCPDTMDGDSKTQFAHLTQLIVAQTQTTNAALAQLTTGIALLHNRLDRVEAVVSANVSGASRDDSRTLEQLAERLEAVAARAHAQSPDIDALNALTARLEHLAVAPSQNSVHALTVQTSGAVINLEPLSNAISSLSTRLASIEASTAKIPRIVSKQVDELMQKQEAWRRRVEAQSINQDDELFDRLDTLESKISSLPTLYRNTFLDSLEKQTESLTGLIKAQAESAAASASSAKDAVDNVKQRSLFRNSLPPIPSLPSLPSVPDMGIAKRFSKLSAYVSSGRPSSSQSLASDNEPKVSSPLTQEPTSSDVDLAPSSLSADSDDAQMPSSFEECEYELEMDAGDVAVVTATAGRNGDFSTHFGWWYATNGHGKEGWIPSNYVKRL
ncbi:hypothetical protein BDR26DRAFT_855863 [Obelidium mucronatum]|nr:hypothetical protein BDR26DRAFT_855863 [Obelidium mucronatum]